MKLSVIFIIADLKKKFHAKISRILNNFSVFLFLCRSQACLKGLNIVIYDLHKCENVPKTETARDHFVTLFRPAEEPQHYDNSPCSFHVAINMSSFLVKNLMYPEKAIITVKILFMFTTLLFFRALLRFSVR